MPGGPRAAVHGSLWDGALLNYALYWERCTAVYCSRARAEVCDRLGWGDYLLSQRGVCSVLPGHSALLCAVLSCTGCRRCNPQQTTVGPCPPLILAVSSMSSMPCKRSCPCGNQSRMGTSYFKLDGS
jgi:hypothetical protein